MIQVNTKNGKIDLYNFNRDQQALRLMHDSKKDKFTGQYHEYYQYIVDHDGFFTLNAIRPFQYVPDMVEIDFKTLKGD